MLNFRPILRQTIRKNRSQTLNAIFSKETKCQLRHSDSQVTLSACRLGDNYRHVLGIAGKYKRLLFFLQLNYAKMIYLACDSIPDQLQEKIMISSFAKISGTRKKKKKKKKKKKTTIEICKVRLPVLVNPASSFSNRSVLRFPPEKLWFKPTLWPFFYILKFLKTYANDVTSKVALQRKKITGIPFVDQKNCFSLLQT